MPLFTNGGHALGRDRLTTVDSSVQLDLLDTMAHTISYILMPSEVTLFVETLEKTNIEDVGSMRWYGIHERLQKLHQQAVLEATGSREESVKDAFVSYSKVPALVYEAICISVWREQVFPLILQMNPEPTNTFMCYMVLYHEDTVIALLEAVLFHADGCESLEEAAIDLVDYCAYAVVCLESLAEHLRKNQRMDETSNNADELKHQQKEMAFDIGIRSISILQYIADNLERLPLSVTTRMFVTHDVPMLFKNLIDKTPWTKRDAKNQTLKYIEGKWQVVPHEERMKLTRTEALIWLGLRQLLLGPRCPAHYEINDYRRNQLAKLQAFLHDVLLDQLSPLIALKQWLSQLAVSNPPSSSKRPIVVEIVPQIRQSLLNRSKQQWKLIAKRQSNLLFNMDQDHVMDLAKSLSETYNIETLDALSSEPPKCVNCGEPAAKRCSRCKDSWYCGRECQVKNWPKHKTFCDNLSQAALGDID